MQVVPTKPPSAYDGVPAHQLAILEAMDVPVRPTPDDTALPDADVLLDALIGYSLSGDPRGTAANLIRAANDHTAPVLEPRRTLRARRRHRRGAHARHPRRRDDDAGAPQDRAARRRRPGPWWAPCT